MSLIYFISECQSEMLLCWGLVFFGNRLVLYGVLINSSVVLCLLEFHISILKWHSHSFITSFKSTLYIHPFFVLNRLSTLEFIFLNFKGNTALCHHLLFAQLTQLVMCGPGGMVLLLHTRHSGFPCQTLKKDKVTIDNHWTMSQYHVSFSKQLHTPDASRIYFPKVQHCLAISFWVVMNAMVGLSGNACMTAFAI